MGLASEGRQLRRGRPRRTGLRDEATRRVWRACRIPALHILSRL